MVCVVSFRSLVGNVPLASRPWGVAGQHNCTGCPFRVAEFRNPLTEPTFIRPVLSEGSFHPFDTLAARTHWFFRISGLFFQRVHLTHLTRLQQEPIGSFAFQVQSLYQHQRTVLPEGSSDPFYANDIRNPLVLFAFQVTQSSCQHSALSDFVCPPSQQHLCGRDGWASGGAPSACFATVDGICWIDETLTTLQKYVQFAVVLELCAKCCLIQTFAQKIYNVLRCGTCLLPGDTLIRSSFDAYIA